MVSAAAGSMALVAAPLVRHHGPAALAAAAVMAGALQLVLARLGIHRLLARLPRSVAIGFVNGLAILIFLAQLRHVVSPAVLALVVGGAALTTAARLRGGRVPPSLISTAAILVVAIVLGAGVPTVGDAGALPAGLPGFAVPDLPLTWAMLGTLLPYAASLAVVGLVESLLTADLIDRLTDTPTSRRREATGQGLANIATGFFGGQPGCAMIGQSLLNVETGGRGRLSTLAAGAWLLLLVVALHPLMAILPMAALVATMVVVAFTTFDWRSISVTRLRHWPRRESATMAITAAVVVATSNLAIGVLAGAAVAAALLGGRITRRVTVTRAAEPDLRHVHGSLFFGSTGQLVDLFENARGEPLLRIDLTGAELLDTTASLTLAELITRHRGLGHDVEITGLSPASEALHARVAAAA